MDGDGPFDKRRMMRRLARARKKTKNQNRDQLQVEDNCGKRGRKDSECGNPRKYKPDNKVSPAIEDTPLSVREKAMREVAWQLQSSKIGGYWTKDVPTIRPINSRDLTSLSARCHP